MKGGGDPKQEDMVDFIERKVWSSSYLNLGYFVFFSSFVIGLVRSGFVVKPQV
jgi:hypothetical protein